MTNCVFTFPTPTRVLSMRREWEVFMIKYGRSTPTGRDLISGNLILSDASLVSCHTHKDGAHHVKLRCHQDTSSTKIIPSSDSDCLKLLKDHLKPTWSLVKDLSQIEWSCKIDEDTNTPTHKHSQGSSELKEWNSGMHLVDISPEVIWAWHNWLSIVKSR